MKKYEIRYSELAKFQINDIYNYLSYKFLSISASKNILKNIYDKLQLLAIYPNIGTKIKNTKNEYRIIVKRYIVFYQVDKKKGQVIINEIVHKLQNQRMI